MSIELRLAADAADLARARELFLEYQAAIGIDLCFQGFPRELAGLPGDYAPPAGRLVLALEDGRLAGCGAIRPLGETDCEMKRLYVRAAFRGRGLGRRIAEHLVQEARAMGYRRVLLDTLELMRPAVALYRSLGFEPIPPYGCHPLPGSLCFALALAPTAAP